MRQLGPELAIALVTLHARFRCLTVGTVSLRGIDARVVGEQNV